MTSHSIPSYIACVGKREPFVTFNVPPTSDGGNLIGVGKNAAAIFGGTYSIFLPSLEYWSHVTLLLLLEKLLATTLSITIYKYITNAKKKKAVYHVGFGIIIPVCILFPYAFISLTGMQNSSLRFILSYTLAPCFFRCLEAMFGSPPHMATSSLFSYSIYFSTPVEFVNSCNTKGHVKSAPKDIKQLLYSWFRLYMVLSILSNVFFYYGQEPFPSNNALGRRMTLKDYFDPKHLGNYFILAITFQVGLAHFNSAISPISQMITGYEVVENMSDPLFQATSPTDFWGRRWNLYVHGLLKRGVYKPMRRYNFSSFSAYAVTFIASGLFHEWLIHIMFMYQRQPKDIFTASCYGRDPNYTPQIGSNTVFFLWNAFIMIMEKVLSQSPLVKALADGLPSFIVTFFVIMTALPVAHWFCNPYVKSGFFHDNQAGFPMIIKIE